MRPSPLHGRGVFAATDLRAGTIVEVAPVVVVDREAGDAEGGGDLARYLFEWDVDDAASAYAVALGIGSLFNHRGDPSCRYERIDDGEQLAETLGPASPFGAALAPALIFTTTREVAADEELTIDYSGCGDDDFPFSA